MEPCRRRSAYSLAVIQESNNVHDRRAVAVFRDGNNIVSENMMHLIINRLLQKLEL